MKITKITNTETSTTKDTEQTFKALKLNKTVYKQAKTIDKDILDIGKKLKDNKSSKEHKYMGYDPFQGQYGGHDHDPAEVIATAAAAIAATGIALALL